MSIVTARSLTAPQKKLRQSRQVLSILEDHHGLTTWLFASIEELAMRPNRPSGLWPMLLALVVASGCGKNDEPRQLAAVSPETLKKPAAPRPEQSSRGQPAQPPREPDKSGEPDKKPAASRPKNGSAEAYFAEWRDDNVAAGEKYTGKVIELTGEIRRIQRTSITLKGADDPNAFVRCNLAQEAPVAKLGHGQTVKVRGSLQKPPAGFTVAFDPTLVDCKLVELGPNPEKPVAAVALAKEYAADKDKTIEKYNQKCLAVEGEIGEVSERKIFLKGGRRAGGVSCLLDGEPVGLKVGQRVRALGQFSSWPGVERGLELTGCLVVVLPDLPAPPAEKPLPIALLSAGLGLRTVKAGDYITYALVAKIDNNPETGNIEEYTALEVPIRHLVAGRNANEVTLKSVMRSPGGWNERPPMPQFQIDLTQPHDSVRALLHMGYTWVVQEDVPVKFTKTGAGQQKRTIGGKTYECDWAEVRVISEDDDEVVVKVWFSAAVPLTGLVRLEATSKTRHRVFSSISLEFTEAGDQAAADAQAAAIQKEIDKLKGAWRIESIEQSDGKVPEKEFQKLKKVKVSFSDAKMTWSSPEEKESWEPPFWLDPGQKPRIITMTLVSNRIGRPTQFSRGIYSLEGDTLQMCFSEPNKPRPTEFKVNKETGGARLITYKREKP